MATKTKALFFMCLTMVYVVILLIAYFGRLSGPLSIFILLSKLSVYIVFIFLVIRVLYLIIQKHAFIWQFIALISALLLIIFSAILFPLFAPPNPKSIRMGYESNLKQYYLNLKQYADDNNGYFPFKNDMDGLNELVLLGYLPNLVDCWEYNFSSRKFIEVQPNNIYRYYGGHTIHETPPVIIMDSNHDRYKTRLYNDGHVETRSVQELGPGNDEDVTAGKKRSRL
jgi:hypothetical protein